MNVKPGRNDPCPCGSGKKFKKCCHDKDEVHTAIQPKEQKAKVSALNAIAKGETLASVEINQLAALFNAGHLEKLEIRLRSLIEQYPNSGFAWKVFGATLQAQGKEALPALHKAIEFLPDDCEAHNNLGFALQQDFDRLDDAVASFNRALKIKPDFAEAHNNLGNALRDLGQLDEAVASFHRALKIKPDYALAYSNLGNTLQDIGRLNEAAANFRKALEINPVFSDAHYNLGNVLELLGQVDDAKASYRQALEIKPDHVEALCNLGTMLQSIGQLNDAVFSYRQAVKIKPDFAAAHSNLLFALNYSTNQSPSYYLAQARQYGQMVAKKVSKRFTSWQCAAKPVRLRVGLVSGDLRNHSAGHFLEGLILNIDQSRIELIAYPTQPIEDDLTALIRPYFSIWKSLLGKSDSTAADLIHNDGVHVLLDLSGHSAHNRLPVFAWKPAPVQSMWLGYFASTGLAEMDYIIGDKWLLPDGEEHHFMEKGWRLPDASSCMTPPQENISVNVLPALQSQSFTFGSLNNFSKMNDQVVACWARILNAIPHSRLYLNTGSLKDSTLRKRVIEQYAAHGVAENRLILEATTGRNEALKSYNKIDIALDSFPYPGGTSSFEALWMGVPVLTLRGNDYLSHAGESIMHNAGLPEWIAENKEDYIAKATAFASNLPKLAALRRSLRDKILASLLYDMPRFARDFESALWGMWQTHNTYSQPRP